MEFEPNHILSLQLLTSLEARTDFVAFADISEFKLIMVKGPSGTSGVGPAIPDQDQDQQSSSESLSGSPSPGHSSDLTVLVQDDLGAAARARQRKNRALTLGFRPITQPSSSVSDADDQVNVKGHATGSLDFRFLKRFLKIHCLLFGKLNHATAHAGTGNSSLCLWLFLFLVLLCLLNEYIIYHVGLIPSKYYKILGDKDVDGFWGETAISTGIIVAVAMVKSTKQFVQKLLTACWRQILSKTIHHEYFRNLHYYKLNVLDQVVDNPDQRMTQDVDKFTSIYCDILPKFILAPFLIGYYSYEAFTKSGWQGPTACFGFFIIGAIFNRLLMGPVVRYVIKQEKYEGDFRFIHMLVRISSESIAFHNGSELELDKTNVAVDQLISTQYKLYLKQYFLNISVNLFDYFGSILSYLVLAIPIFTGVYDDVPARDMSSIISQNSFVTMYLIFQFTSLVDISVQFADITGVSHRIGELIERLQSLDSLWRDVFPDDRHASFPGDSNSDEHYESLDPNLKLRIKRNGLILPVWTLDKLSFAPPYCDEPILRDLTLTISTNQSLLIIGPSSSGKSSLFRILHGLWPCSHGSMTTHFHPKLLLNPKFIFYSPQKSYLTAGTLRQQIAFPLPTNQSRFRSLAEENAWIHSYLQKLDLSHLLIRVGNSLDEPIERHVLESLSPGEIQRLCVLRVFYQEPLIAVLDEATSALPAAMEEIIYEECQRLKITTISVGHRDSLRRFHDKVLVLNGEGGWELHDILVQDS